MTSLEFELCNNLMAGLTLRAIEEKFPCFIDIFNSDFENQNRTITVVITCREEDAPHIKDYLAPFV